MGKGAQEPSKTTEMSAYIGGNKARGGRCHRPVFLSPSLFDHASRSALSRMAAGAMHSC